MLPHKEKQLRIPLKMQPRIEEDLLITSQDIALKHIFKERTPSVIVEIGAFDGIWAKEQSLRFPSCFVHTIEPCPKNFRYAQRNTRKRPNIKVHQTAITDREGEVDFYITQHKKRGVDYSSQSNSLWLDFITGKHNMTKPAKKRVQSTTLEVFYNSIKAGTVDWLHCNCEGGEYLLFKRGVCGALHRSYVVDITFHAKSRPFTNKVFRHQRAAIHEQMLKAGFELYAGEDMRDSKLRKHIRQVWLNRKLA